MDSEMHNLGTVLSVRVVGAVEARLEPLLSDPEVLDLLFAYSRLSAPASRRLAVAMVRTLLDAER